MKNMILVVLAMMLVGTAVGQEDKCKLSATTGTYAFVGKVYVQNVVHGSNGFERVVHTLNTVPSKCTIEMTGKSDLTPGQEAVIFLLPGRGRISLTDAYGKSSVMHILSME